LPNRAHPEIQPVAGPNLIVHLQHRDILSSTCPPSARVNGDDAPRRQGALSGYGNVRRYRSPPVTASSATAPTVATTIDGRLQASS
jgi:hypothetical protein